MTVTGWRESDLASVVSTLESGSRPKGGASTDTGEIASLGGENIVQTGGVNLADVKRVPLAFFNRMTKGHLLDGDILINKDGAQTGKIGIYLADGTGSACINEHLFLIRGDDGQVSQQFLYYTLLSENGQRQISAQISGSAQPGLKSNFLKGVVTVVPVLLAEQTKIAEILSTLDRAIEQTEALIAKQQRITSGLRQDLLTRGVDDHGNVRSEQTHQFKDSSQGRIPIEWSLETLERCVRNDGPICYGILMPGPGYEGGIPVIKVRDIVGGRILRGNILLTDPKIDRQYKRSKLHAGDLVLTIRGTTGRVARVPDDLDGANITQDTARVRLKDDHSRQYFYFLLQSRAVQDQVQLHTIGQAVKGINIGDVKKIALALPRRPEQDAIAARLQSIQEDFDAVESQLRKLYALKTGLMQDLLTGRRRVTALLEAEPKRGKLYA